MGLLSLELRQIGPIAIAKLSTSLSWVKGESHRCLVADNTVWFHIACDFPWRCGDFHELLYLCHYFSGGG